MCAASSGNRLRGVFPDDETSEDAIVFAITEAESDTPVGTCGLYLIQWICRRAQLNILVGKPSVWDKAMSEAVSLLLKYGFHKLNRIPYSLV